MTDAERATGKEETRNEVIGRRTPVISFSDIASPPLIDRDRDHCPFEPSLGRRRIGRKDPTIPRQRFDSIFECFAPEMNRMSLLGPRHVIRVMRVGYVNVT